MLNNYLYKGCFIFASVLLAITSCQKKEVESLQKDTFIKYFGAGLDQHGAVVEITSDGGFVVAGTTSSFGHGGSDMYVVKTDVYGNIQWEKTFGGAGNDEGRCVRNTPDGGYIVVGTYVDTSLAKGEDIYLVKLDAMGNAQWEKTYGVTTHKDFGQSVIPSDGGYVIIGTTENIDAGKTNGTSALDVSDGIIIKTDGLGNQEWQKIDGFDGVDKGLSVRSLSDTSYVWAGSSANASTTGLTIIKGREDGFPIQYVSNGYFNKALPINEPSISNATDILYHQGHLYVTGTTLMSTSGTDIYLMKIDLDGNKIWYQTYGGALNQTGASLQTTSDGGFVLAGTTENNEPIAKDIFLIKTNSAGDFEWSETFGGDGDDVGSYVYQTSDGGYIITGTASFGGNGVGANNVMCLIKTTSKGKLVKE